MRFVECDVNEVTGRRAYGNLYKFLKDFDNSGLDCAKVENHHHKTAVICANGLRVAIKKYKFTAISVVYSHGNVYLIRKSKINFG